MKESEITELASSGMYEGHTTKGQVEETHISWVILSGEYAFKIKKPLKLSFLNFSTTALRKHYCEREVELNKRFTDIYLSVQPVLKSGEKWLIGGDGGEIIDYCVVMKRLSSDKRMDILLRNVMVEQNLIEKLAGKVASCHENATKVLTPFDLTIAKETFNDILSISHFVRTRIGTEFDSVISKAVLWSNEFLTAHAGRFQKRIDDGFRRDVHGDLHAGNIFLYPDPVIFDCIEFNDQFRQIDVLYEIAYLCMDLESVGHGDFADVFLKIYSERFPVFYAPEDRKLFNYFKALRANVRAKVHAISADHEDNPDQFLLHSSEVQKYLSMVNEYCKSKDH